MADASIRADVMVHFKTGATLSGVLHEMVLCPSTEVMRDILQDAEFMRQIEGQEYSFVNLDNVAFINVQNTKVVLPDMGGTQNEEG
jgi:hypothetical protein